MKAGRLPRGIAGYAVRWGEWSRAMAPVNAASGRPAGDFRERFAAGAFDTFLARLAKGRELVELQDAHDGPPVASTARGTLAVWADPYGLAFAADLPAEPRFAELPVSLAFHAKAGGIAWNGPSCTVSAADLLHIALIRPREMAAGGEAAYPGARAWFDGWPAHAMPPHVDSLRARWTVGRMRAIAPRPAPRPMAKAKAPPMPVARTLGKAPPLPPHIIAMLDDVARERAAAIARR